jgi:hypothetical protein
MPNPIGRLLYPPVDPEKRRFSLPAVAKIQRLGSGKHPYVRKPLLSGIAIVRAPDDDANC